MTQEPIYLSDEDLNQKFIVPFVSSTVSGHCVLVDGERYNRLQRAARRYIALDASLRVDSKITPEMAKRLLKEVDTTLDYHTSIYTLWDEPVYGSAGGVTLNDLRIIKQLLKERAGV